MTAKNQFAAHVGLDWADKKQDRAISGPACHLLTHLSTVSFSSQGKRENNAGCA